MLCNEGFATLFKCYQQPKHVQRRLSTVPSQIPPIPVGMFKACSKQLGLNLISHLQDKHKNLLTWGAFTQVSKREGWDCLGQLPPWTALFKLAADRNFPRVGNTSWSATRLLSLVLQSTLNPVWNVCILTTLAHTFLRTEGNCPQGLCWP